MDAIYIPQLAQVPNQTEALEFEEFLPGLETLTPVKGQLQVSHHGNYLQVEAESEAIMTLTCHRCLQCYNHRLRVDASEMIWLSDPLPPEEEELEKEVTMDELVETLPPQGYFNPGDWLYEQFCLAIPQRQLCDAKCPGIQVKAAEPVEELKTVDRRWASLEALRNQFPNGRP